jgi:putative phosphoesterase
MKIGLLSDIHGNANALEAVLASARKLGVKRLLCAGDFVGYYYEPRRCLNLLESWDFECVRGNHEDMLFSLIADPSIDKNIRNKYGSGLAIAACQLTPEQLRFLADLPKYKKMVIENRTILLCHGSPWDTNHYIYPDASDEVFSRCADHGIDYVVLGHTHYQMLIRSGNTCIVNPGAVGQPRGDKRGAAHWAILDLNIGKCEHQETEYQTSSVIAQTRINDPELPYLSWILTKN